MTAVDVAPPEHQIHPHELKRVATLSPDEAAQDSLILRWYSLNVEAHYLCLSLSRLTRDFCLKK